MKLIRAIPSLLCVLVLGASACGSDANQQRLEQEKLEAARDEGAREAKRDARLRELEEDLRAERRERRAAERRGQTHPPAVTPRLGESGPDVEFSDPAGFHTGRDAGESVVATVCAPDRSELVCWTPNDGFTLRLSASGSATRSRSEESGREGFQPGELSALAFGQTWTSGAFTCTNAKAGLTCRNGAGRGFTLPRYRGLPAYI